MGEEAKDPDIDEDEEDTAEDTEDAIVSSCKSSGSNPNLISN